MRTINDKVVGTCSLCGGAVTLPVIWFGVIPPIPTCSSCGAVARQNNGPVIPMEPRKPSGVTSNRLTLNRWPS